MQRAVGVTTGSLDTVLGPRRFFLPIRVGGGGSHFGFGFCKHRLARVEKAGVLPLLTPCPSLSRHLAALPSREEVLIARCPGRQHDILQWPYTIFLESLRRV